MKDSDARRIIQESLDLDPMAAWRQTLVVKAFLAARQQTLSDIPVSYFPSLLLDAGLVNLHTCVNLVRKDFTPKESPEEIARLLAQAFQR